MENIQLFIPKFRIDESLALIKTCLEKGWTGMGYLTIEIEENWKKYSGLPNAHFLNSNTSGLHLALEVLKRKHQWSDGDEIITSPLTFVSSNHAILYSGLTPVFTDVDETLCLDPESVLKSITDKTRAVMFVGMGGNVGNYEKIVEICREKGLKVILDAAHMAGTRVNGTHVGGDADVAVFSFQAVKNLPTADSGMICFSDEEDDATARRLSWLGINKDTYSRTESSGLYKWRYEVDELGYKYHGNSIMAALAITGLNYLDEDNSYRRTVCTWYDNQFAEVSNVVRVKHVHQDESSRHLYQIRVKNRDAVLAALNELGIFPGVHYRDNTEYSIYSSYPFNTPNSRKYSGELISLPLHLGITQDDVERISNAVISITNEA